MLILSFLLIFVSLCAACTSDATDPQTLDTNARQQKVQKMFLSYQKEFASNSNIAVQELIAARKQEPIVLVDVREKKERLVSIIPGAIPLAEFEKKQSEFKKHRVVFYCTIGYRSGKATQKFSQQGFKTANLVGGVLSWAHQGKEFENQLGQATKKVHVYGKTWNLLPLGYEAIW